VKNHRLILLAAIACILFAAPLAQAEFGWLNDYKKAQQEAKTSNRLLLVDFTGSDCIGWIRDAGFHGPRTEPLTPEISMVVGIK